MESKIESQKMPGLVAGVLINAIAAAAAGTLIQYLLFETVSVGVTFLVVLITVVGITRREKLSRENSAEKGLGG